MALLAGCIGMRTPLDDAAIPIPRGEATDSTVASCGSTVNIDTRPVQTDILIVLDRSDSMIWSLTSNSNCAAGATGCTTRAAAVVSALSTVVTDHSDIRWGLELFPTTSGGMCSVPSAPEVAISSNSTAAIESKLAAFSMAYSTPTAPAIDVAVAYLKTVKDANNKVILLATDGLPTCGGGGDWTTDGMTATTAAVATAKNAGFLVYVVGIGPSVGNLNSLAEAGGTGSYYPATSTDALDTALAKIAKVATSTCVFKANTLPPDKDLVTVYVDAKLVAQDGSNGWAFDPSDPTYSTIVLTGAYCQNVLAGATAEIQITFGCPDATASDASP
jgi:hypothetical protein